MRFCSGILLVNLLFARTLLAQHEGMDHAQLGDVSIRAMVEQGPHITLTPLRPEQPGDRARADSIAEVARVAVAKYKDVALAEADGYTRFAPQVKQQRIYHYTNRARALRAQLGFDAAAPTALLYRDGPNGSLVLVGVMYTAPASLSLEELDRRIPLSIARWHQHTNICLPPRDADQAAAIAGRHPEFGPRGRIATEAACEAAGGRWKRRVFNWMVHANVFEDRARVWADEHGGMRHH